MGSAPELLVIGLTCNLVGIFLLANSIVFRSPRQLIAEHFGIGKGSIRPLRDYVLNKIQVVIGFLFLTAGFVMQALSAWPEIANAVPVLLVCGALVGVGFGVYLAGARFSRRSFRHLLREFFRAHPFSFHQNIELTKQIGKVFGIHSAPDESVEAYVAKVMFALGLDPRKSAEPATSVRKQRLREMAPLPVHES